MVTIIKTMDLPELIVNKQKKTIPLSSRNNNKRKLSYVTSPAYVTSPTYLTSPAYVTLPAYVTSLTSGPRAVHRLPHM